MSRLLGSRDTIAEIDEAKARAYRFLIAQALLHLNIECFERNCPNARGAYREVFERCLRRELTQIIG